MALNFNKYKTYDTSEGFGNKEQWKKTINNLYNELDYETKSKTNEFATDIRKIILKQNTELKNCKTERELKLLYRKLLFINHPDKHNNSKESNDITIKLTDDYNLYLKKLKRKKK